MSRGLKLGLTVLISAAMFASLWLFSREVARLAPTWMADEPSQFQLAEIRASRFFLRHVAVFAGVPLSVIVSALRRVRRECRRDPSC